MFFKNRTPGETIIASEKKKAKLRNKRSKLNPSDPNYQAKTNKINGQIHEQNVKIDVAKMELKQPVKNETTVTKNTSVNFNKNDNGKSLHFHGHYHSAGKNKKK